MRTVQIYINDEILDLFDDENIEVSSSIQNINDIAKVFTDFSQQFTVPASPRNNEIFKHYYQNDVEDGFIAKERQPARIEINYTPFRRGKIQLEGAELVEGEAQHYSITFYGDVVTLKDLFGDDKLRDLDYSSLSFEYSYANVKNSITSTAEEDIRFPLISSERVWEYGDLSSNDIETSAGAINYTELQPAVRVPKIIEAIEDTYGVTFTGNFLTNDRFKKLYTWWKNADAPTFNVTALPLAFNPSNTTCITEFNGQNAGIFTNEVRVNYVNLNLITPNPPNFINWFGDGAHSITIYIGNTSSSNTYYLDVFRNGVIVNSIAASGDTLFNPVTSVNNVQGLNDIYTFEVRAENTPINFDFSIAYKFVAGYLFDDGGVSVPEVAEYACQFETLGNTMSSDLNISLSAPDMLVSDYFSGVLRMFNLTCYPTDENTFQVEPLEFWYSLGEEIDITEYTDVSKIKIDRPKLYNNIEFNWKESKAFLNEAYKDINNLQYGTLRNYFGYDGGDFKIELPFETLLFSKFTGTNLQVSYSLEEAPSYTPYIPAPVMLYLYDSKTVSFYLTNGVTPEEITSYMPFGQEIFYNAADYSINFNEEISSLSLEPVSNSLYNIYYRAYLQNLFSNKARVVTVETNLPLRLLNSIQLNDALIIRDKKYRINLMKSQLTTGKVTLELITDIVTQPRTVPPPAPPLPVDGGDLVLPIKPIKPSKGGYWTIVPVTPYPWITTTPITLVRQTGETNVEFDVAANGTGSTRSAYYDVEFYDGDGNLYKSEPYVITQGSSVGFILTEDFGYLLQENLDKLQQ